ncbi:MAG: teichoic acid biosynthesis protein, partial [Betaproteobacteria bacterium]|nr:teichoic acid biosynthesis protein [Betaproteobacteria bacterium]
GDAPSLLEKEFPVARLENLGTVCRDYKVDLPATVAQAVPILLRRNQITEKLLRIMDDFKPDCCMTDLEYFVPRAAKQSGLACLTLDHQHVITCCRHKLPPEMWFDYFLQGLTPRYLFSPTEENLIISFYAPPVRAGYNAKIAPPILRRSVQDLRPCDRGHVLVYQSNSTHRGLLDFLKAATRRTCYIFGYKNKVGREGNLVFRPKSEEEFLELLEGASYVICGGGHTLMTEALFLGKAILSLPLKAFVEQRFNALYIEQLGYGMQADMFNLRQGLLAEFEAQIGKFTRNVSKGNFCGNQLVFDLVTGFISTGRL